MSHWSVDANIGCGLMQALDEGDVSIRLLARGRYKVTIRGIKGRETISVGFTRPVKGVVGQAIASDLATALGKATLQAKGVTTITATTVTTREPHDMGRDEMDEQRAWKARRR